MGNFRTKRKRRQAKAALLNRDAAPRHRLRSGRTGTAMNKHNYSTGDRFNSTPADNPAPISAASFCVGKKR